MLEAVRVRGERSPALPRANCAVRLGPLGELDPVQKRKKEGREGVADGWARGGSERGRESAGGLPGGRVGRKKGTGVREAFGLLAIFFFFSVFNFKSRTIQLICRQNLPNFWK